MLIKTENFMSAVVNAVNAVKHDEARAHRQTNDCIRSPRALPAYTTSDRAIGAASKRARAVLKLLLLSYGPRDERDQLQ